MASVSFTGKYEAQNLLGCTAMFLMNVLPYLWSVGRHSIKNTAVRPRKFWASYSLPWKLEISQLWSSPCSDSLPHYLLTFAQCSGCHVVVNELSPHSQHHCEFGVILVHWPTHCHANFSCRWQSTTIRCLSWCHHTWETSIASEDESLLGCSTMQSWGRATFHPNDGGSTHLWNVGLLRDCTALYPRRLSSSCLPPWEPEILQAQPFFYLWKEIFRGTCVCFFLFSFF
jgi:hypothetical protein